jgi:uncharacterized repeat protein (TIGR03943 family)
MSAGNDVLTKLVRFTAIILFSAYTIVLYINEQLLLYIHPRLLSFTVGMAAIALVIALLGLGSTIFAWFKARHARLLKDAKETVQTIFADKKIYLLAGVILLSLVVNMAALLIPIVLLIPFKNSKLDKWLKQFSWLQLLVLLALFMGYAFPPRTLSPQAAAQTSAGLNALVPTNSTNALSLFNLEYDKYTIGDWIKTINLNPDLQSYENKPVDVVGFVFSPSGIPDGQFLVSRFVISCCAVDARPVGLNVLGAEMMKDFKPGDWVRVKGSYKIANVSGEDTLQIVPTEISAATQPKNPYIY